MPESTLPTEIDLVARPLFEALPLASAMTRLVVTSPVSAELSRLVGRLVMDPAIASRPALAAGLWLYVDELDRSHQISQGLGDATGSFWHGIMHRREGDFSNSHYWFRRAGQHPACARLAGAGNEKYDPRELIDRVEAAAKHHESPAELIEAQRREWAGLFAWCAEQK